MIGNIDSIPSCSKYPCFKAPNIRDGDNQTAVRHKKVMNVLQDTQRIFQMLERVPQSHRIKEIVFQRNLFKGSIVQRRLREPATCDRQCRLADFTPKALPSECRHSCQVVSCAATDVEDPAPAERRKCSCFQSEPQAVGQKTQCLDDFKNAFSFSPNCM